MNLKGDKMKRFGIYFVVAALIMGMMGCASMKRRDKGAIIGAASGGIIGGIIGKQAGNTAVGAILGAAVGGTAGAVIGNYMDKQAEDLQADLEGAKIERVGEGIKITFSSGILFNVNKSDIQPTAQDNLTKLATILNKYPDTQILVEGHTDSDGRPDYNMDLSLRRANSVVNFLTTQQVDPTRFHTQGYGETQPVADNTTVEGKAQNRRVEIAIFANDKLKHAAEEKQSKG
jgi:outer membrane protein OmpA-like peptidoglycan-associated protein